MRLQPFDLVGGFYQDDSRPWSVQDTVNWIPEAAEASGTRTASMLRDAPGLRPIIQVGEGPIRGLRNVEGKLLCVSGNELYQITNLGVAIPRGTIPGTGAVSITHNQASGSNQVLIVNGAAGYVYDTSALTLTKITDAGYPGAFVADFIDGYLAQIEPLRRYWFHSELLDALSYNTLDRYPAEGQPDALVTLIVDHREVWVFGERTCEVFINTGAATNTFQRASNTVIEHGCSGKFSVAKLDNSLLWLDDLGIVRRSQGYTATRVSTGPIEQAISKLDWSRAFAYTVTDRGHAIYYLTFPDGQTFGYDVVTGLWHRRESYGLNRWRPSCMAYWNDTYIAGDFQQGLLYALDWDYPYDGELPHVRRRITGVTHADQSRVLIPYAEIIAESGTATVSSITVEPQPDPPIISGIAPDSIVDDPYTHSYTITGGTAPLIVSLFSGSLPPGLTLSTAGVLSGTPTAVGAYPFTVRVTDALGLFDDLPQSLAVVEGGIWFAGNIAQNGASGGSNDYYVSAMSPGGLISATPTALPANGTGSLTRISVANGKVFLHRGTAGSVSSNGGATWTACSIALNSATDVFWNGTNYWSGLHYSADGITWSAVPNQPTGANKIVLARDSDGMAIIYCVVSGTDYRLYSSTNNGSSWTQVRALTQSFADSFATDGTRIWWTENLTGGRTTADNFVNVNVYGDPANADYQPNYGNGWVITKGFNGRITRTEATALTGSVILYGIDPGSRDAATIRAADSLWVMVDQVATGSPQVWRLWTADSLAATWTDTGQDLYGLNISIGFLP